MNAINTPWQALGDRLTRFTRRRVPDPHAADDIVQETLARSVAAFGNVADESAVTRWAYRTARNLMIDRHRRVKPETTADIQALPSQEARAEPSRLHESTLGVCASMMLSRLEPAYREAVTLADLQGVSQQALADRLGISLSGMKSRVQRGRAKLRGMLLDCCRIDFDRRGNVTDHQCTPRSSQYCGA